MRKFTATLFLVSVIAGCSDPYLRPGLDMWIEEEEVAAGVDSYLQLTFFARSDPPITTEWRLTSDVDGVGPMYGQAPTGEIVAAEVLVPLDQDVAIVFVARPWYALPDTLRWARSATYSTTTR